MYCFLTLAFSAKAQSRLLIFCKCVCQAKFPVSKLGPFLLKRLDRLKITHKRLKWAISLSRSREGQCIRHTHRLSGEEEKVRSVQKYHFIYCSCRIRWNRISFSVPLLNYALKKDPGLCSSMLIGRPFYLWTHKAQIHQAATQKLTKSLIYFKWYWQQWSESWPMLTLVLGLGFQVLHSCKLYECR